MPLAPSTYGHLPTRVFLQMLFFGSNEPNIYLLDQWVARPRDHAYVGLDGDAQRHRLAQRKLCERHALHPRAHRDVAGDPRMILRPASMAFMAPRFASFSRQRATAAGSRPGSPSHPPPGPLPSAAQARPRSPATAPATPPSAFSCANRLQVAADLCELRGMLGLVMGSSLSAG